MKFVITGLPRSRSAWFSAYLTNGDVLCYHEAIYHNDNMNAREHTGTADCGYVFFPEWALELGEHKLIIIHRDPKEVKESLTEIGLGGGTHIIPDMVVKLRELNGLHVGYNDIDERLEEIHEYLDIPYDRLRAELFINMKIQAFEWSK